MKQKQNQDEAIGKSVFISTHPGQILKYTFELSNIGLIKAGQTFVQLLRNGMREMKVPVERIIVTRNVFSGIVFVSNERKNLNKGVEDDVCDIELLLNYQNKITKKTIGCL